MHGRAPGEPEHVQWGGLGCSLVRWEENKDGERKEHSELERSAGMRTACHNSALMTSHLKLLERAPSRTSSPAGTSRAGQEVSCSHVGWYHVADGTGRSPVPWDTSAPMLGKNFFSLKQYLVIFVLLRSP